MRMLLVAAVLAISGCGEQVQNAPAAGTTVLIPEFEWRVVDADTMARLHAENGIVLQRGVETALGMQGVRNIDGRVMVYTLPPKYLNDRNTCTLGHEVMHIALGAYHK